MDPSTYQSKVDIMEERFKGLELEVELLKSKMMSGTKSADTPSSSGAPSVTGPNQGSDPTASNMIKELEIRLERTEEERNMLQSEYDDLRATFERWKAEYDESREAQEELEMTWLEKFEEEKKRSRALFQKLQEMKGNIRVMCRIRPASADTPVDELVDFGPREKGEFSNSWGHMELPVERKNVIGNIVTSKRPFDFERIFGPEESNNDVFNEISDLVECALQGDKVGIFAYGQTGSGKTYTLSHKGPEGGLEDGIIPRTVASMFKIAESSTRNKFSISLSILEIYINSIFDLQEPIDGEKVQTRIEEAKFLPLESLESAETMIEEASRLRVSSSTNRNETSSRSHLILTFQITRENLEGGPAQHGFLYLVDLAGSERSAASGLNGAQLQEGIKINESLMSLNLVITALGKGTHVAYDTVLTKALRPVLAHDSKTLMFVMVSPLKRDLITSIQTLEKGQEATNAKLAAVNRNDARRPATSAPAGVRTPQPALSRGLKTPTPNPAQSGRSSPNTASPRQDTPRSGRNSVRSPLGGRRGAGRGGSRA
ncbi:P-loop containing nucleoside triphosphate hydrolase protein [Annulohypoxylon maeteangense]|uniref:P-loop containing nucleoside triphosphate hydrolase protein n=1 Tax=Annulohypoxylon maeteangense TaxID=1927788 RepID=UPI00200725AF|nr:P-loop containing nucleoside triphosphate hydrolase protein [Annulohypoxylon maeteangense]KAI0890250.1 P-loop containing nucleoside triphosphate hydrolase protein [Annulohypoxylon maeteangense]